VAGPCARVAKRTASAGANTPWPLFQPRPALRKLAVLADADLLTAPDDVDMTRAALLTGLLTHPYLKVLRYQDEGPATEQPGDGKLLKSWARLLAPDDEEYRGLVYAHDSGRMPRRRRCRRRRVRVCRPTARVRGASGSCSRRVRMVCAMLGSWMFGRMQVPRVARPFG
jgi:hypothetical protein